MEKNYHFVRLMRVSDYHNNRPLKDFECVYYYKILRETDRAFFVDSIGFGKVWLPKRSVRIDIKEEFFEVTPWLYCKLNDNLNN